MTITQAEVMTSMRGVSFIQQDRFLNIDLPTGDEKGWRAVQTGDDLRSWGLDRIDQRTGLDGSYNFDFTGRGVTAYVIDSGIDTNHEEFRGRILQRQDFTDDVPPENCPTGSGAHGTHVAGTIGGTTSGVAKEVNFVDVRVFKCNGDISASALTRAFNFVADDAEQRGAPAVANASLGGGGASPSEERAVRAMRNAGVLLVDAAGNEGKNACETFPAGFESTFTVASIKEGDIIYVAPDNVNGTNWGRCVDIFAPGVDIMSAELNSVNGFISFSGTSMAGK
jgi:serine protease